MNKLTIAKTLNVKEFPFRIKDKKGNLIYGEWEDGFWERRERDANGNLIYHEDSDEYWEKTEWDANGNKTYCEDSTGFWEKTEYNSDGREIYFENSEGEIIDNRTKPKPIDEEVTIEINGKNTN